MMARIAFTPNLARHIETGEISAVGATLRDALEDAFRQRPSARGYVLDDQHRLRKHVVIFIDGKVVEDRETLSDAVSEHTEVYVMQALSGG